MVGCSTFRARKTVKVTPGQNGGELVISYSGGKLFQSPKDTSPQKEKESKEFTIVQKELEALQSQISHSQAVLASLKFTFLENTVARGNSDKVHRTTQTLVDAGLPKSLEDVPSTIRQKEKPELARSCPVISSIAVQTDGEGERNQLRGHQQNPHEDDYFLPPIETSLELQRHKEQVLSSVQNCLDLDIYRSCRKLSVLPEEEIDDPPTSKQNPVKLSDNQAHSFDSYLIPTTSPSVIRQMSDPTPSTRRPLQVATLLEIVPSGVEDSGLGSEVRVSSPSPTTPCYKTPPATPSSDNSLSWQTPTSSSESPEPEKQLLSVLMDPGGSLAPAEPLVRVSSRRRLVRSLARIASEAPDIGDESLESPPQNNSMSDVRVEKDEGGEANANQPTFPNLTDADLKKLGLCVQTTEEESERMDDENLQTDKMTLSRRLELQNKLRDQAELNMTHEVETLKSAIELLNTMCSNIEQNDLFEKIRLQIEALYKSALRVSSTAEVYGAVQQENRLSKAVDIILKYVDNLKHMYDKEKTEHEETRKLLQERRSPATTPTDERRGSTRRGSNARRLTISKTDSQNDILKTNGQEGDSFEKIFEGCETCGSRLRGDDDSNGSQPNSSDGSSDEETRVFRRGSSFKEESNARKILVKQKFRKRASFCAPLWVQKISKYLIWLQPYEDIALQIRYFIASLFVLAAFLIVAASFFQSSD